MKFFISKNFLTTCLSKLHQQYSRQALYTYDVHENRVVKNVRKVQLEATVFWVKKAFVQSWSFVRCCHFKRSCEKFLQNSI